MSRWTRRAFLAATAPLPAAVVRPAGRGLKIASERVEIEDPLTGRDVVRLTDPSILHHLPHYHHRSIARDHSFLLTVSERSGSRQIYRLNLPDGDMVQLTDGGGVHSYSPVLDRRGRNFCYLQRDSLLEASARGGRGRVLYRSPDGWRPTGHLSVSRDERFAALVEMRAGHQVDGFEAQFERRPRCRLQVIEVGRKKARTVTEENHWLSHPRFRPRSTDLLYSREGPWDRVDGQLRYVSFDGGYKRNLRPRRGDEQIGHAYWSPSGREVCYAFFPDASGRQAEVRCVDPKTGRERTLSRCSKFGWLSPNADGSAIVGASRSLAGPNIYLLFPKLGREITLGEHAASCKPYPIAGSNRHDPFTACPEPVFSPDSKWVYYVTDREGKPALYAMDVSDFVEST